MVYTFDKESLKNESTKEEKNNNLNISKNANILKTLLDDYTYIHKNAHICNYVSSKSVRIFETAPFILMYYDVIDLIRPYGFEKGY